MSFSLPLLLDLSARGSIILVAVLILDRVLAGKMTSRWRRVWWLLVPLAFLLPVLLLPAILADDAAPLQFPAIPATSSARATATMPAIPSFSLKRTLFTWR